MSLFGWIKKNHNTYVRYVEEKDKIDIAMQKAEVFLDSFRKLLCPLIGSKELAIRLTERIIVDLRKENIELTKKSIDYLYREILRSNNESEFNLDVDYANDIWIPESQIADMIDEHIELLERFIKIEFKMRGSDRILKKKELINLIKLLKKKVNDLKHVITLDAERIHKANENEPEWSKKLRNFMTKNMKESEIRQDWNKYINDTDKLLDNIKKLVETEY